MENKVRDHIPLEQGLRLYYAYRTIKDGSGQRPYSIRTRIKTSLFVTIYPQGNSQRPYSIRTRIKTSFQAR